MGQSQDQWRFRSFQVLLVEIEDLSQIHRFKLLVQIQVVNRYKNDMRRDEHVQVFLIIA